jgi:hypothetical protein
VIGWKLWERKKKDGQREETAAGFWFQREKEKEGAQFFSKRREGRLPGQRREGNGSCWRRWGANSWLAKEKKNGGTDWKMKGNGAPVRGKNGRGEALILAEKIQQGGRRLLPKMEKKVMVLGLGFFCIFY